jgi:hypothetical protein
MFTFNKTTGSFNVDFGTVNVKKSKLKMKQLIPDEQDPIFLIPLPIGSVVVFDKDTGRYSRKDKAKKRMETESEEEEEEEGLDDDEMNELELEIERDMKRQAVVDLTVDDILDDLVGPDVEEGEEGDGEEEEEEEEEEEQKEKEALVVLRDQFIETHNDVMAKGVVRAIREGNIRIPKTVLEKTPQGVYDRAQMVKLSYDVSAAQNEGDLNDAEKMFIDSVQSKSLVFKRNYSNREAVVVHDVAENIYHVAWHGANADGGNSAEDWESIKNVMSVRFDKDPQFIRADEDLSLFLQHIAEVDPEARVRLTGYSLGGAKSLHLAEKYNLEGMHINAFTSPLSKYEMSETDSVLLAKQQLIRIVDDPFTAQSAVRPLRHPHNREYTNLLPLKDNTKFDDGHSLDQFTSNRPRGADNLVEKTNLVGKSLGHAALIGGAVYGGYAGAMEGKDNSGTLSEEVYRGVLGSAESSLPIVGEGDILESGLVGFTKGEVSNAFSWVKNSIFGKKLKPEQPDVPVGFTQVSGQGFVAPPVTPPTRRLFGPQLLTPPTRRQFGPQSSPQPFPPNPRQS